MKHRLLRRLPDQWSGKLIHFAAVTSLMSRSMRRLLRKIEFNRRGERCAGDSRHLFKLGNFLNLNNFDKRRSSVDQVPIKYRSCASFKLSLWEFYSNFVRGLKLRKVQTKNSNWRYLSNKSAFWVLVYFQFFGEFHQVKFVSWFCQSKNMLFWTSKNLNKMNVARHWLLWVVICNILTNPNFEGLNL